MDLAEKRRNTKEEEKPFMLSAYSILKLNKELTSFLSDSRKQAETVIIRPCIWAKIILTEQCKKFMEVEK